MKAKMILTVVFSVAVFAFVTGCQGGLPLMAQTNPQTQAGFSPITKEFNFFSNDGKTFDADEISATWNKEGGSFKLTGVKVHDKSVENREANVKQIEAGAKQLAEIRQTVVGCAQEVRRILNPGSGIIDSASPAAVELARIASELEYSATSQPASHED